MLTLRAVQRLEMIAACIRALPNEGCGLLVGTPDGVVCDVVPSENVAHSARIYEIDPRVLLRTSRRADDQGRAIIGVFHSHTHSEAYPSPTDVRQAPDPSWHYVIVSLRDPVAQVRSYLVVGEEVTAEEISLLTNF